MYGLLPPCSWTRRRPYRHRYEDLISHGLAAQLLILNTSGNYAAAVSVGRIAALREHTRGRLTGLIFTNATSVANIATAGASREQLAWFAAPGGGPNPSPGPSLAEQVHDVFIRAVQSASGGAGAAVAANDDNRASAWNSTKRATAARRWRSPRPFLQRSDADEKSRRDKNFCNSKSSALALRRACARRSGGRTSSALSARCFTPRYAARVSASHELRGHAAQRGPAAGHTRAPRA